MGKVRNDNRRERRHDPLHKELNDDENLKKFGRLKKSKEGISNDSDDEPSSGNVSLHTVN